MTNDIPTDRGSTAMDSLISPERLKEMRARAEKASDGPWETNLESLSADEPYVFKPMWGAIALVPEESPQRSNAANNLRFIAQAREDIPALLASHDELTAEVERLRTALGRIANPDQRIANNELWIQGAQEIARDALNASKGDQSNAG